MEAAIQTLVKVFLKSSKGRESLGKKEFQTLVKSQLSNILSDTDSKEAVNNMGQQLDANHDGKVGFEEYMKLVGYLAVSVSEQHTLAKQETAKKAAPEQGAQTAAAREEDKSEAKAEAADEAEAGAEAKVEGTAEPTVQLKLAEPTADLKPTVDLKVDANASPKVEVNAEGAAEIVAASKEEQPAAEAVVVAGAGAGAGAGDEATAANVVTEAVKVVTTEEKVEEVAQEVAAAAEEVEKKTEEATS